MGRLHGRLATLEKRFIPDPNAARDEVLQRALARLTIQELKLLIEAATRAGRRARGGTYCGAPCGKSEAG
jgi:hypothetical protein